MLDDLPTLGIRFDLEKVNSGVYGIVCWTAFWETISLEQLRGAVLLEGDSAVSRAGREDVFIVAVQCEEEVILSDIKRRMIESEKYRHICARPRFVEGDNFRKENVIVVARVDCLGNLVASVSNVRMALEAVRGLH